MTRLQMRQLVLNGLDDSTGGYFDQTFIDNALNLGLRETRKQLTMDGEMYYLKMPPA